MDNDFAAAVRHGLSKPRKELPSRFLYDDLGTALFEAITHLPEYGLTRADEGLLCGLATELPSSFRLVVELGSGTGSKTRPVLKALSRGGEVRYSPVDVSAAALAKCRRELGEIAEITPLRDSYLAGLEQARRTRRRSEPILVLFLGSTIGNFDPACRQDFLRGVRAQLEPGDALLIGFDLVKPVEQLLAAYDDPTGVTAAFNRNLLGRVNRELGGTFRLEHFAHEARYDAREQRIEMHLRSQARETVHAAGMEFAFERGETIWTESSYKFQLEQTLRLATECGFRPECHWVDEEWPFAECYWSAE
ncbi:MAG: L-histidine N(alpha)-methyltransferase [Bryobacteraceae bacterium]|nr:L-histidine N(alpha)-methyltransferase [Bryobacteraceae bacterium]